MTMTQPTLQFSASVDEVNLILVALGKLPLEQSVNLWSRLRAEAQEQLNKESANDPPR